LERQSLGHFGLVTDRGGMTKIWEGSAYRTLEVTYGAKPVCQRCTMRRPALS
jgi:hypothetical protein